MRRWRSIRGVRTVSRQGRENHAGPRATIRHATRQAVPRWFAEFGADQRALPHGDVAGAVATVCAWAAWAGLKLVFEFLVLTAARSAEARLATWEEMDLDALVWTVPAARTKVGREHRVPLSSGAVELLDEARRLGADSIGLAPAELVFPGRRGKAIRDATLSGLLQQLGIRGGAARLPVQLPGLGGGADGPPARGDRGGTGARGAEPDRGGIRAVGPVRAAPSTDERLDALPDRAAPDGFAFVGNRHRGQKRQHVMAPRPRAIPSNRTVRLLVAVPTVRGLPEALAFFRSRVTCGTSRRGECGQRIRCYHPWSA